MVSFLVRRKERRIRTIFSRSDNHSGRAANEERTNDEKGSTEELVHRRALWCKEKLKRLIEDKIRERFLYLS